jgi:archaellum component FlaC
MPPYSLPTREDDPVHLVRTVGRLAQMIIELRDEYVREPRSDTLDQIERRLDELAELREQLRERLHPVEVDEMEPSV